MEYMGRLAIAESLQAEGKVWQYIQDDRPDIVYLLIKCML